jgi:hypothetical protein
MKYILCVIVSLLSQIVFAQNNLEREVLKTPVTVTSFFGRGSIQNLEARVLGASNQSRVVVFLRLDKRYGLQVATNHSGEPQLPTPISLLPELEDIRRSRIASNWRVSFYTEEPEKIFEIYIVACEVRNRSNSTPERDYSNFKYLPFSKASDIENAIELLRDFGWNPTGFTKITP